MDVAFYGLCAKHAGRKGPGRRYYCLVFTRRVSVNTDNRAEAYEWACANAIEKEQAVSVDNQPVSPLTGIPGSSPVFDCLKYDRAGKPGYVFHTALPTTQVQVFTLPDGSTIPLSNLDVLALADGSVVAIYGVVYAVYGDKLLPLQG